MSYIVKWTAEITCNTQEEYDAALANLTAARQRRADLYGENWVMNERPIFKIVDIEITQEVQELDEAG